MFGKGIIIGLLVNIGIINGCVDPCNMFNGEWFDPISMGGQTFGTIESTITVWPPNRIKLTWIGSLGRRDSYGTCMSSNNDLKTVRGSMTFQDGSTLTYKSDTNNVGCIKWSNNRRWCLFNPMKIDPSATSLRYKYMGMDATEVTQKDQQLTTKFIGNYFGRPGATGVINSQGKGIMAFPDGCAVKFDYIPGLGFDNWGDGQPMWQKSGAAIPEDNTEYYYKSQFQASKCLSMDYTHKIILAACDGSNPAYKPLGLKLENGELTKKLYNMDFCVFAVGREFRLIPCFISGEKQFIYDASTKRLKSQNARYFWIDGNMKVRPQHAHPMDPSPRLKWQRVPAPAAAKTGSLDNLLGNNNAVNNFQDTYFTEYFYGGIIGSAITLFIIFIMAAGIFTFIRYTSGKSSKPANKYSKVNLTSSDSEC